VIAVRHWLPALICVAGVVVLVARGFDETGWHALTLMLSAGLSVWLLNILFRLGVRGDRERDAEDEARAFFDRHGFWPDDPPPGHGAAPPGDARRVPGHARHRRR
jgi:hypothetical protein